MSRMSQEKSKQSILSTPGTATSIGQIHKFYRVRLVSLEIIPHAQEQTLLSRRGTVNLPDQKTQQGNFAAKRLEVFVPARQSFLSIFTRLVGAELYKIQCRAISKALGIIGVLIMISAFTLISLGSVFLVHTSPRIFLPPACSRNLQGQGCLSHKPNQADLARAEHVKQETLYSVSAPLRFPNSLNVAVQITRAIGLIIIVILAGIIVGGEYSTGTVRLMLTRGPTRTQFLFSKLVAVAVCIVVMVFVMVSIGVLTGSLLNLLTGIATNSNFLTTLSVLHAVLYVLVAMLGLFLYATMAFFLSIIGRTTTAGIVGALVWSLFESVIGGGLSLISSLAKGSTSDFLKSIPDYFIGNNIAALLQNQGKYVLGQTSSPLSDLHSLLVLGVYFALFIGVAIWVNKVRDVTN
jgi:ABC-type transport system involved in multi-copper enzyme maturation permease subunit